MIPKRLPPIASRWSISAVFTLSVFAPKAHTQSAATAINGVYNGTYTCAIGPRTLKLSLLESDNGSLTGVFTFFMPPTSHSRAYSYTLNGTLDPASGKFRLNPVRWETPPPPGYTMVGLDGVFVPGDGLVAGKITYSGCSAFQATRNPAGSADTASAIVPQPARSTPQSIPNPSVPATVVVQRNPPPRPQVETPQPSTPSGVAKASAPMTEANGSLLGAPLLESDSSRPSACDLISLAEAQAVVGFPLRLISPGQDRSKCIYMGYRPGMMSGIRLQVIVEVRYSAPPNPGAVNQRRKLFHDSVAAGVLREIPGVADAALWDWTNDDSGTGRLVAYRGGSVELFVTIVGISEDAALRGAERLATQALGGKTGYVYTAAPAMAGCDPHYSPISKCQPATEAYREMASGHGPKDKGQIMAAMQRARTRFWATYPDKEGAELARKEFRALLNAKDFYYLGLAYSGALMGSPPRAGEDPEFRTRVLDALNGIVPLDRGIQDSATQQFEIWVEAVRNNLGIQNGADFLLLNSRISAALAATERQYEAYVAARDLAEFRNAGRGLPSDRQPEAPPLPGADMADRYIQQLYLKFGLITEEADAQRAYRSMMEVLGDQEVIRRAARAVANDPKDADGSLITTAPSAYKVVNGHEELDDSVAVPTDVSHVYADPLKQFEVLATYGDDRRYLLGVLADDSVDNRPYHTQYGEAQTHKWEHAKATCDRYVIAFGEQAVLQAAGEVRRAPKRLTDGRVTDPKLVGSTPMLPYLAFEHILARADPRGYVRCLLASEQNLNLAQAVDAAYRKLTSAVSEDAVLSAARTMAAGNPLPTSSRDYETLMGKLNLSHNPESPPPTRRK